MFVGGRGVGGGKGLPCFCGEPIVPSSVVPGAAVTLDSRWLGLRAVGESESSFQLCKWITFVAHNIAGSDCSNGIWEQFGCIVLRPISAKRVLKMSVC